MYRTIVKVEQWASLLLTFAMFLLIILQVISRYLFEHPLPWTEELARYVMIWMIFIASAHLTSTGGHIVITLIDKVLPAALARWVIALSYLIVTVTGAVLMVPGWTYVSRMFMASSPAMGVPMAWVYMASFLGFLFMMVQSFVNFLLVCRGRIDEGLPVGEPGSDADSTFPGDFA